jgi:hypothetical protein
MSMTVELRKKRYVIFLQRGLRKHFFFEKKKQKTFVCSGFGFSG